MHGKRKLRTLAAGRPSGLATLVAALLAACAPPEVPAVVMGDRATLFPPLEIACQDIVGELYRNTSGREMAVHLQILDTCARRDGKGIKSRVTLTDAEGVTRRQEHIRQLGAPTVLSFLLRPEEKIRLETGGRRGQGHLTYVLGVEARAGEAGDGRPRDIGPAEPEATEARPTGTPG